MSKVTPNPVKNTFPSHSSHSHLSSKTFHIAGILTTVFGLDELGHNTKEVACLWLLHPRLQSQACMQPFAASIIGDWNERVRDGRTKSKQGLIAVSFDQRNHGSREIDPLANEAWRSGNKKHAQDMFSVYHGTAVDTSLLLGYLAAYAFPDNSIKIARNLVLGVSLGGHAAWHVLMQDPRFNAAIICIGCPDYVRLMSDRARLSKLKTYTESTPPGSTFVGSTDFPVGLLEMVQKYDPAGLLFGELSKAQLIMQGGVQEKIESDDALEKEKKALLPTMNRTLKGKRILNLVGGADKLVPYRSGEPFLSWLKRAIGEDGWYEEGGVVLEDMIFDGVGHEVPDVMVKEILRFVRETLDARGEEIRAQRTPSRI